MKNTKINDPKKQTKTSRVEINILLNIFKFYILKYIIKFLQSGDNNKKKYSAFIILQNQWSRVWSALQNDAINLILKYYFNKQFFNDVKINLK